MMRSGLYEYLETRQLLPYKTAIQCGIGISILDKTCTATLNVNVKIMQQLW